MSRACEANTNVILVCVTNKQSRVLTHDKFFKIFGPFGKILRILIFERAVIWKTFVEFDNPESAHQARMTMNGADFGDEQMKMNVYASQLQRITFQENNSGGVDYTILRQKIEEKNVKGTNSVTSPVYNVQKSMSNTTSPLYPKTGTPLQPIKASYSYVQSPTQFPQYYIPQQPQQQTFDFSQQQVNLTAQLQQHVQKVNHLMYLLQQTNEQQYHYNNNHKEIERQQQLVKELQEMPPKITQLLDQYSQILTQQQNIWAYTPDRQSVYSGFVAISENTSSNGSCVISPHQQNPQKKSPVMPAPPKPIRSPWSGQQQLEGTGKIQFIKSFDGDSDVQNQSEQNTEPPKSDDVRESEEADKQIAKEMDELLKEEENEIFNIFWRKVDQVDARQILSRLNVDMKGIDQQNVVAFIENHIHSNSSMKSFNSCDNIDHLIIQSKLKQQEQSMKQLSYPPPPNINGSFQATSPDWSAKTPEQLYDDVTENSDPAEYVNPLFLKVVRKSKVIYARWFDRKIVTLKMLYNIFSTFGNIDKMIYLKERSSALIQYQTLEHASMAKESLNDISFYGQQIKIFYSNYEEIYLKAADKEDQEEYFQGCEESHRFKEGHTYSFNPPCDTIQVSNLAKESCNQDSMYPLFEAFGRVLKHKFVLHPSNRNTCFLKLESVEVSLTALANLNGILLDGRILQLTFSKQRL